MTRARRVAWWLSSWARYDFTDAEQLAWYLRNAWLTAIGVWR